MVKVFIDSTGWNSIINSNSKYHVQGKEYFQQLLDSKAKIYTNIIEINRAIYQIKIECDSQTAQDFSRLIDEAVLKSDISLIWLTRRNRRTALKQFFSIREDKVDIRHCLIFGELKKRKINAIFTFDDVLKYFGIPLMPQV
jgi:predicted nucleic acid-binding protein